MAETIDLYVELCSDGSLLAYDKNHSINTLFTDLMSWGKLHYIYELATMPSSKRKGLSMERNIKYVRYMFKDSVSGNTLEIEPSQIQLLLRNIVEL